MNTRRFAVRIAASATLIAALTLGAHAFVPQAFGCSAQSGNSGCRQVQTPVSPVSYLDLWMMGGLVDLLLP